MNKPRTKRRGRDLLEAQVAERTAELRAAQAELNQALETERELGRMKSQFVNTVSHEFRTPLGVILSSADILENYFDRLTAVQRRQHLADIQQSTRHLASMVEHVVQLGHLDAGGLACQQRPLDLSRFLRALIVESLPAGGARRRIAVVVEGCGTPVEADESLLRHIFLNLLSNALKYSPPDSPIDFSARRVGVDVVFTVRDRGLGIPAGMVARLFAPFVRGENVAHIPGTGLGLVIVRRCVELHGGTVTLASTEGEGTTVTVRLTLYAIIHPAFRRQT